MRFWEFLDKEGQGAGVLMVSGFFTVSPCQSPDWFVPWIWQRSGSTSRWSRRVQGGIMSAEKKWSKWRGNYSFLNKLTEADLRRYGLELCLMAVLSARISLDSAGAKVGRAVRLAGSTTTPQWLRRLHAELYRLIRLNRAFPHDRTVSRNWFKLFAEIVYHSCVR